MSIVEHEPVTIDPSLFTVVIQFEIDADAGEAFARDLTEAVGKTIVQLPGFRGSVFQLSLDRTRVLNYAQWDSQETYERSIASTDMSSDLVSAAVKRHGAKILSGEPYRVVTTFRSA